MKKPIIIGVAGGSGCGKTTVVKALAKEYPENYILVIHMDHYYRDRSHMKPEDRNSVNFDHPDAIEHELLVNHLTRLKDNQDIERPTYDFVTHTRSGQLIKHSPRPIVILDGIFSLYYEDVRSILDLKIFIDLEDDLRFIRRLQRDMRERGRDADGVVNQYLKSVRPMHKAYIEPTKFFADLILSGLNPPGEEMRQIKAYIERIT